MIFDLPGLEGFAQLGVHGSGPSRRLPGVVLA